MPDKQFCLCTDDGAYWLDGPFDSLEAAREARPGWEDDHGPVTVHEVVDLNARDWIPSLDEIIEHANEHAWDERWGGDDCDPVFDLSSASVDEAQAELNAWADKWIGASLMSFAGSRVKEGADV